MIFQGALIVGQVRVSNNRLHVSEILSAGQLADVHDQAGYQYMPFPRDVSCGPQGEWIRRGITADSWMPVMLEHETTIVVASSAHLARIDTAVADIKSLGLDVKAVERALRAGYRALKVDKEVASAAVHLFREKLATFDFTGNRLMTRAQRMKVGFQSCETPVTQIVSSGIVLLRREPPCEMPRALPRRDWSNRYE